MNIETLNRWGENFLSFAWPMLWQSSLLIVIIFALDVVSARKIRPAIRHALWMVVLLKLLLPPTLALPTGVAWWLWPAKPALTPVINSETVTYDTTTLPENSVVPSVAIAPPPPRLGADSWAMLASSAISAGLLCWLAFKWLSVGRNARMAKVASEFENLLGEAQQLADLRGPTRLRLIDDEQSPAVYGLFRPVILLPRTLAERLSGKQLRAVLLHEAIHIRRGDVWVNCAQTLLQIAYWWHPLLWFANARIRRLREEAVDDAVMLALRDEADAYAPTLLEVAKFAFRRPLASLGLVGILESRSALRQRIERLVDFRPPRRAGVTLLSLCGIFLFSAVALPMGRSPVSMADSVPATPPSPPASAMPSQAIVFIEGQFFWMPPGGFETVAAGLPYDTGHPNRRRADVKQFGEISQRIRALNLKPFLRPRIQTCSGIEADFYIGDPTNGVEFDCTPFVADERIDLAIKAELRSVSVSLHDTTYLIAHEHATVENNGGIILRIPDPGNGSSNLVLVIGVKTGAPASRANNYELLNGIQLTRISYQNLALGDVLGDLRSQSVKLDPKHKGLNFLYNPNVPGLTNHPATSESKMLTDSDIHISIKLNNVSMAQVLYAICLAADRPIKYSIEDYGVVFSPKLPDSQSYEMRTFKVDPNLFYYELLKNVNLSNIPPSGPYGSIAGTTRDIGFLAKKFFQSLSVNLDPPKTLFYNDRLGILFVYAAPRDLDVIEGAMQVLGDVPPQIHIKARFIDMPSTAGIVPNLLPADKDRDLGYGILTAPQMKVLLHKLQSQNGVEELAEPESTTIGGRQVQMRATTIQPVVTNWVVGTSLDQPIFTYPEWTRVDEPDSIPPHNSIYIQPETAQVETGSILDTVPVVLADRYTINLKATGTLIQFLGYADTKGFKGSTGNYNGGEIKPPAALPQFQVTSTPAQEALLYDGQTLVLFPKEGQPLPYLPGEKSQELVAEHIRPAEKKDSNKTLAVFVTVTMIDRVGNRIHSDKEMPFAQDAIPPQPQILPAKLDVVP